MRRKGFTLIEIIIAIAILSIIIAIGVPQVLKNIYKARRTVDIQNAKHIAYAFYQYESECGQSLDVLIPDSNFHEINSEIINLSPNYSFKITDYISGGVPKPIYRPAFSFYYKLENVLKVYSGDGTNFYELFPEVNPNY